MGKSHRKPYGTFCSGKDSAANDKRVASRSHRRQQEAAIRKYDGAWEDFVIPVRYEAAHNDVWGWNRDGKQRLQTISHNTLNPYWVVDKYSMDTEERLIERRDERVAFYEKYIKELSRK